jgi:hypothetical protein
MQVAKPIFAYNSKRKSSLQENLFTAIQIVWVLGFVVSKLGFVGVYVSAELFQYMGRMFPKFKFNSLGRNLSAIIHYVLCLVVRLGIQTYCERWLCNKLVFCFHIHFKLLSPMRRQLNVAITLKTKTHKYITNNNIFVRIKWTKCVTRKIK